MNMGDAIAGTDRRPSKKMAGRGMAEALGRIGRNASSDRNGKAEHEDL
jgi:hypothetical protein